MKQCSRVSLALPETEARGWRGLACGAALAGVGVMLLLGCAGTDAKQAPPRGDGGEGGGGAVTETGGATHDGDTSEDSGSGGVGGISRPIEGRAGESPAAGGSATDDVPASADPSGGVSSGGGGGAGGVAGMDAEAGAPSASGAAGDDGGPPIPVSVCGPGQWFPGEGPCMECPTPPQVFELECADYASAQVLLTTTGQLQYVFASLPSGVQAHEGSPVEVPIAYLLPDESHLRLLRFNGGTWSVDLRQAPNPPEALVVPPFSTADVCGNVFHSREAVRFERTSGQGSPAYAKTCP